MSDMAESLDLLDGSDSEIDANSSVYRKRSFLWLHFEPEPENADKAKCNSCKNILSIKGGATSNLAKHLKAKHIGIYMEYEKHTNPPTSKKQKIKSGEATHGEKAAPSAASDPPKSLNGNTAPGHGQRSLPSYFRNRCVNLPQQQKIDNYILNMVVKDIQPFSVVEDRGFRELIAALEPNYKMVSRKRLRDQLLPQLFDKTLDKVKQIVQKANYVTLTTDTWTSSATENYMAVTAHFIDESWKLKSVLLECCHLPVSHTAENLRNSLLKCVNEWEIADKIYAVVSDNAANICAAVKLTGWAHIPCFAHTTNLIVRSALKVINALVLKIKEIVEYFHRSTTAAEKLKSLQHSMNGILIPLKLKNDVVTRWNSTFYMLKRALHIQEPLQAAIGVLNKSASFVITDEEWLTIKEVVEVLSPFEELTVELSAEKNVTVSKVILMTAGLKNSVSNCKGNMTKPLSIELCCALEEELNRRFSNLENSYVLGAATLLDPRFKNKGFSNKFAFNKIKEKVSIELENIIATNTSSTPEISSPLPPEKPNVNRSTIWETFDSQAVCETDRITTPKSTSIIEFQQFLQEKCIDRTMDPLEWWAVRKLMYPNVSKLAKKHLGAVATSVPSERIFSKSGEVISTRRSMLKSKIVEKIVFLNANNKFI